MRILLKLLMVVFFLLSITKTVFANVYFNEIQISPAESRFIELYNSGSTSVDLTGWYIQRKTATGSSFGSLVSKTYFEGKEIGGNEYFVISRNDLSTLTLTESNTIQFKNSEGDIVDKIGWGDCEENCTLNPSSGKSIQKINGSWVTTIPTLGEANSFISSNFSENNVDAIEEEEETPKILKISAKIISKNIVIAGVPFKIDSKVTTNRKETYMVGGFLWNFGDGMVRKENQSKSFDYLYQYPGEYVLTLDYYKSYNFFSQDPETTSRMIIKVIPSDVIISSIGTSQDSYIEIENKSKYEVVMSDWVLKGQNKNFVIPKGTTILAGRKIKFSPKTTGFNYFNIQNISLLYPSGEVVASFPFEEEKPVVRKKNYSAPKNFSSSNSSDSISQGKSYLPNEDSNIINLNDLGASVGGEKSISQNKLIAYLGLFFIILLGSLAVYFARKPSTRKVLADEGIEGPVRAEDISILE